MSDYCQGQPYIVSPHIVFDIMAKRWPIVFPGYEFMYFLDTKVACQWIVVMPTNKLYLDDFRNVSDALVV